MHALPVAFRVKHHPFDFHPLLCAAKRNVAVVAEGRSVLSRHSSTLRLCGEKRTAPSEFMDDDPGNVLV